MRCASGWLAIFDSRATLWARLGFETSLSCNGPNASCCANDAHDSSTGRVWGLSPSSWAIAPAAEPLAGPGTKNWAPVSGLAPGA